MIANIHVVVGDVLTSLVDMVLFGNVGDDGLGMSPLHRLEERGPLQHGVTDLGFRLDPRFIRLVLGLHGSDQSDLATKRRLAVRLFRPRTAAIALRFTLENGDVRQIDCYYAGDMAMPSSDRAGGAYQKLLVTLKAADPVYYDPTQAAYVLDVGEALTEMQVPSTVPTSIGSSTVNSATVLTNNGDWDDYPIIRLFGALSDPIIINTTTGERLDFTGATIADGDYFEIDCRYGHKTVIDQDGVNQIAALAQNNSDLATFHLAAGENNIQLQGSNIGANATYQILYYHRYVGI